MTELFEAIRAGDAARVTELLDGDPTLANATDANGVPALALAKYNRQDGIARLLEQRGATLDVFLAAMTGNTDRLSAMLDGDGSLAKAYSRDGWTALHLAAFFNQPEAAKILIAHAADPNARGTNAMQNMPIHAAVAGRATEVARLLVEAGAAVNARQHGGWTALHSAAQNGDVETARLLIGAGAEVQARAENQQSAMDLALTRGHQSMVELLDHFGAAD